jgi:hypothetical protein
MLGFLLIVEVTTNLLEFYYITATVAVRTVLHALSETMCGNLIISGKISHVHLSILVYILGLIGAYGAYGTETMSHSTSEGWNVNFVL